MKIVMKKTIKSERTYYGRLFSDAIYTPRENDRILVDTCYGYKSVSHIHKYGFVPENNNRENFFENSDNI